MKILCSIFLVISAVAWLSGAIFSGQSFENIPAPHFARINFIRTGTPGGVLLTAGGSIISNRHVLCAAHTLQTGNTVINVHIGGNTRQSQRQVPIDRILQHPDYVHTSRINDIGIVFLNQSLSFSLTVRPINLPGTKNFNIPFENVQGQVLGFGGTANNMQQGSNVLEGAFVRVNNETRCSTFYPAMPMEFTFCAEDDRRRSDFCEQDIGGGFTMLDRGNEMLVGIASQHRCLTNTNIPSMPALYTRITPYLEWIREEAGL